MVHFVAAFALLGAVAASNVADGVEMESIGRELESMGRELSEPGSGPATPPPSPPSPFSPPGAPGAATFTEYSTLATVVAAGSETDFGPDVQSKIQETFATASNVPISNVTVSVKPGSVVITTKVVVSNSTAASSVESTLSSKLSSKTAASTFLSANLPTAILVVSDPVVYNQVENYVVYPPPPPPPSDDKLSGGAIAGIVIGSLLGAALIAFLIVNFVMGKRDPLSSSIKEGGDVTFSVVDSRLQENV